MKPKPYRTVDEMLDQEKNPTKTVLPYDIYSSDRAAFLTLAVQREFIAVPLVALGKATLGGEAASIVLEFGRSMARIEGRKLDELFEDILLSKVRVVRVGRHPMCTIERILVSSEALI